MITLHIAHETARRAIAQNVMTAPLGTRVTFDAPPKSRSQEETYHMIIGHVAKQARHMGSKWELDDWKRLLVDQFVKETPELEWRANRVIASLDFTGIVQLGEQTRRFKKKQASAFIEWLFAWCANNGVEVPSHE